MSLLRPFAPLALVLALAAPAVADNTADEADLHFRRGIEAYRAKRYDEALAAFFQSNRLVHNLNVVQNIARCFEQQKMYEEAYRYYSEVLGENPRGEDHRSLEDALARIAPRVALLKVVTTPPGVELYLERKDLGSLGVSPKILALTPGKRNIILSLAGYREISRQAELVVGKTVEVHASLEFIWGRVSLTGEPEGTEARVDTSEGPAAARLPGLLRVKP